MRAAGADCSLMVGTPSLRRIANPFGSPTAFLGLSMFSFVDLLDKLGRISLLGEGAAGKRNSGIGCSDGDCCGEALRWPAILEAWDVIGGRDTRPIRSGGGYEAWNRGELERRGEKDAGKS